jgi:hypothetical protein
MTNTSGVFNGTILNFMTGGAVVNIPHVTGGTTGAGVTCCLASTQPSQTYATPTYGNFASVSTEITPVNGYTAGGSLVYTNVPVVSVQVIGCVTNGNLVYTTTSTLSATWLIPQYSASSTYTTSGNPLLCFLSMGSSAQSVTNGTLTINWNASGIFTLTVATAA